MLRSLGAQSWGFGNFQEFPRLRGPNMKIPNHQQGAPISRNCHTYHIVLLQIIRVGSCDFVTYNWVYKPTSNSGTYVRQVRETICRVIRPSLRSYQVP